MRSARIALICVIAGAGPGCRSDSGGSGRGPAPRRVEPDELSVTIRNNCPESVDLQVADGIPAADTRPLTLAGSGLTQRKVGKREHVWLRYRGEWSKQRSARPEQDGWVIEVLGTCDGIAGRPGPL